MTGEGDVNSSITARSETYQVERAAGTGGQDWHGERRPPCGGRGRLRSGRDGRWPDGTSEASGGGEGGREESTDPPPVDYGDARHLVVRMLMLRKGDYEFTWPSELLQAKYFGLEPPSASQCTGIEVGLSNGN